MRMTRLSARSRLTRKDWTGDAVLTLIGGAACLVAVFLPWANSENGRLMNYGLTHPDAIRGVLHTPWGLPALALALTVLAVGVLMLTMDSLRTGIALGLVTAAAGLGTVLLARHGTAAAYGWGTEAGLGAVLALFTGVLLVPIGLSSAAVAGGLRWQARRQAAAAGADHSEP
jgi:hypothetical protein